MKKEFKTPEIEICAIAAVDAILASGNSTGVLGTGGTTSNMMKISLDSSVVAEYNKWLDNLME